MAFAPGGWPRFLAPLRPALERLNPPEGSFDPDGSWQHRYAVCLLMPERQEKGEHPQPYGTLKLARRPGGGGRCRLDVEVALSTRGPSGLRTRASIDCAAGPLATPASWELRSEAVERGKTVPQTGVAETATVRDGVILRGTRNTPMPRPFTSNWSLLEAVQRLPFDAQPLEFDLLEDLDLLKTGQALRPAGEATVPLAGRAVRLHAFRQIGRGVLPLHYWLDDQHRLLAVTGHVKGLLWQNV